MGVRGKVCERECVYVYTVSSFWTAASTAITMLSSATQALQAHGHLIKM